ncbi:hypothetical protein HaLaN_06060 [Haematococcus lacustris]|uniref:Uncharacterized protein n=1 Tax=Haematococcus lacustris TaxID=44745 RepID=A0A699YKV6_HAELA|nr:hypothetical protein HaLaN_06060 [Haematococcus lacustris]
MFASHTQSAFVRLAASDQEAFRCIAIFTAYNDKRLSIRVCCAKTDAGSHARCDDRSLADECRKNNAYFCETGLGLCVGTHNRWAELKWALALPSFNPFSPHATPYVYGCEIAVVKATDSVPTAHSSSAFWFVCLQATTSKSSTLLYSSYAHTSPL